MSIECPICSRKEISFECDHKDFPGKKIWHCISCDHWFTAPEPCKEELSQYYREKYGPNRKCFFKGPYISVMEKRALAQMDFIDSALKKNCSIHSLHSMNTVDWGCGIGALVHEFQKNGIDAIGYDMDPEAINFGKRCWNSNIHSIASEDLLNSYSKFDLIVLSHTLEHIPDIKKSLRNLLRLSHPRGLIFIEVPNCTKDTFTSNLDTESHLHFFTKNSLIHLFENTGIRTVSCRICGPPFRNTRIKNEAIGGIRFSTFRNLIKKFLKPKDSESISRYYEGFYDHYPHGEDGLWIRYLGQIGDC